MSNINRDICRFQNCYVDKLVKWVDMLNHGENTDNSDMFLMGMFSSIELLMNYDFNPKKKVIERRVIAKECDVLNFDTNSVILYKTTCEDVDPAVANCLSPDDLCLTIERLNKLCLNCNCNC